MYISRFFKGCTARIESQKYSWKQRMDQVVGLDLRKMEESRVTI